MDSPLRTVAEDLFKPGCVLGCGDDEDVLNPCQHERGQGVVDHRFVVDGEHLFGDAECDGVEARA
ncbi:MAG: hypothetical protein RIS92_2240 [Verrucomicrobiota bacterium]